MWQEESSGAHTVLGIEGFYWIMENTQELNQGFAPKRKSSGRITLESAELCWNPKLHTH